MRTYRVELTFHTVNYPVNPIFENPQIPPLYFIKRNFLFVDFDAFLSNFKHMKKYALLIALMGFVFSSFCAEWITDLNKGLEIAKKEKKVVLINFTGSDWCGWCIKFKKEVLSTDEFAKYADKNLVLVELDFPAKKQQPDELKKANAALKDKYGVKGFPTFVVLNADGKEIGRQVGYSEGGPQPFIKKIEEWKKKS